MTAAESLMCINACRRGGGYCVPDRRLEHENAMEPSHIVDTSQLVGVCLIAAEQRDEVPVA